VIHNLRFNSNLSYSLYLASLLWRVIWYGGPCLISFLWFLVLKFTCAENNRPPYTSSGTKWALQHLQTESFFSQFSQDFLGRSNTAATFTRIVKSNLQLKFKSTKKYGVINLYYFERSYMYGLEHKTGLL
jgi:hypothetical protein